MTASAASRSLPSSSSDPDNLTFIPGGSRKAPPFRVPPDVPGPDRIDRWVVAPCLARTSRGRFKARPSRDRARRCALAWSGRPLAPPRRGPARGRARRPPRHRRHPAGRRPRQLRPHGSRDAPDGPPRRLRRALRLRPRPQRGHPPLPREHPLRALRLRPRGARELRLPLPRGHGDAGLAPPAAGLPHRRLRERLPARLALRPRPRVRGLRRPARGCRERQRLPDAGASGAQDGGRGPGVARPDPGAEVLLGAPLRAPRALRAALRAGGGECPPPTTARWPPRTRRSPRSSIRSSPRAKPGARWWCSRPTTARASASTARPRTASSPTRRRCACPWWSSTRVSSRRGWWPRASATSTSCRPSWTPSACPSPRGLPGRSLLALAQGRAVGSPPPSYFEALTPALTRGWAPLHGVLRDRLKYVELPLPELYDLAADPSEQTNLVGTRPHAARGDANAARPPPSRRTPAPGARRSPPRCGSGSPASDTSPPAATWRATTGRTTIPSGTSASRAASKQVIGRYVAGDAAGARSLCEDLVRRYPRVPLGLRHLAFLRRHTGDIPGAIAAGRAALAADAGSVEAVAELGHLLSDVGRPQDAVAVLAPYASGPEADLDVLVTYGVALARTGQRDAVDRGAGAGPPRGSLERSRRLQPRHGSAFLRGPDGRARRVPGRALARSRMARAPATRSPCWPR